MKPLLGILAGMAAPLLFAGMAGAADKLDRNQRPAPGPTPPVVTPNIEKATLKNGLAVWVVSRHELPGSSCRR